MTTAPAAAPDVLPSPATQPLDGEAVESGSGGRGGPGGSGGPTPGGGLRARLGGLMRGPLAAVTAQFLTAGGSLVVQVFASHELGKEGYGSFALVYGVLVVFVAVQNGWVGDSLTVLDRFDPLVRSSLTVSQLILAGSGALACAATAVIYHVGDLVTAAWFAVMAITYLFAELCRRMFMTRREFGRLSVSNLVFVAATWAPLILMTRGDTELSQRSFAVALSIGSACAIALAVIQLPRRELRPGRLTFAGMAHMSRFAIWRSTQIGLRPLVLTLTRVVVTLTAPSVLVGKATVGALEQARLVQAPALTLVQGVGSFLLPTFTEEAKVARPPNRHSRRAYRIMSLGVVGATAFLAVIPLVFPQLFDRVLAGKGGHVPQVAVAGWACYAVAFSLGLPAASYAIANLKSFGVFLARSVDAVVAIVAVAAIAVAGLPMYVGFGVALGSFVGAGLLTRLRLRIHSELRALRRRGGLA